MPRAFQAPTLHGSDGPVTAGEARHHPLCGPPAGFDMVFNAAIAGRLIARTRVLVHHGCGPLNPIDDDVLLREPHRGPGKIDKVALIFLRPCACALAFGRRLRGKAVAVEPELCMAGVGLRDGAAQLPPGCFQW